MKKNFNKGTFFSAVLHGDIKTVKKVLDNAPALVNTRDLGGDTALMYAAETGHLYMAEFLLHRGAQITLANAKGDTAKSLAEKNGHEDVVGLMKNWTRQKLRQKNKPSL